MALAFAETVTVVRQSQNAYGDWTDGNTHDVGGCAVWPTTTVENTTSGQDSLVYGLTVLMPAASDVLSTDLVSVRGTTFAVEGEPATFRSPLTGTVSGIEVHLQAQKG